MSDSFSRIPANSIQSETGTQQRESDKTDRRVSDLTQSQQQKASMNVAILESAAVIIGVKDDPLSLVLSSAIDRINEFLAPELGENAIQKAADSGLDVSPEATAERIVSLATAAHDAFIERHPQDDESSVLTKFIKIISSGLETGFNEARDILEGLDVLEGGIASDIDQTFDLVNEKLAAFDAMIRDMNGLENE